MQNWEPLFEKKISEVATPDDPSHDLLHFQRVVRLAKQICLEEGAKFEVVVPSAWLHDFVIVPKNDPRRSIASRMSADAAMGFLKSIRYPEKFYSEIAHAIEAHSFSAQIEPETIEAKIVQDADRLDGLGAIGIARCFATSTLMRRPFYDNNDPFCKNRTPDDSKQAIDHFYSKLFKTSETLQTASGKKEGQKRALFMKHYLDQLASELCLNP